MEQATQVVDFLEMMFTIDLWRVVHCIFKRVERTNEAISWREARLSEVMMTKLACIRDGNRFCLVINSLLAAIMIERNTCAETIPSSLIPYFVSDWFVVNDERDPKGAKWCGLIIKRYSMQVFPC